MSVSSSRVLITALLFVVVFASGFWMNRSGKPYSILLLTAHKLVALGALALLVVIVYQQHQDAALSTGELVASVVTVLLFVATIITGGLISSELELPAVVILSHLLLPFLTAIASGGTLVLLATR
ncbi:MAG: hypothetical protein GYB65_00425 [Chloroflexi bacterium]|nr:hypothetical protein [Chloroflexota bacterium]